MTTHRFVIEVEVERVEGKFASRDDMVEAIVEAVEMADVDGIGFVEIVEAGVVGEVAR